MQPRNFKKILFFISVSVSFYMLPCSKGHSVRTYLDTVLKDLNWMQIKILMKKCKYFHYRTCPEVNLISNTPNWIKLPTSFIRCWILLKKLHMRNFVGNRYQSRLRRWQTKVQLNSEWINEVIAPKMQTKNYKDFCPTKKARIVALFIGEFLVSVGSFFGYNAMLVR